jgi:hypothetical protein
MATGERDAAVIGCGALGLTTALLPQRASARVTIRPGTPISLSGLRPFESEARDRHRQRSGSICVQSDRPQRWRADDCRRSAREACVYQRLQEYWRATAIIGSGARLYGRFEW